MPAATLCKVCLKCLFRGKKRFKPHHKTLSSLQASARARCPLCHLMYELWLFHLSAHPSHQEYASIRPFSRLARCWKLPVDTPYMGLPYELSIYLPYHCVHRQFKVTRKQDTHHFFPRIASSDSTGSLATWTTVTRWLDDCLSTHDDCKSSPDEYFYPNRLLDVGSSNDSMCHLIISAESRPRGGYVTLSHRWCDPMPIKLTKDTFKYILSGILIQSLPLTFQHAIVLTRRLGKRYFWIDCICIFQDENDNSDWLNEAPMMDRVYANTFVNISATGRTDSSAGLFAIRNAELEMLPTMVTCDPSSKWFRSPTELIIYEVRIFEQEVDGAALNNRGWVFQERWLAPRVLHFGRKQLFWECRKHLLCERFPHQLPEDSVTHLSPAYWKSRLFHCFSMFDQAQGISGQQQKSSRYDFDQAEFLEAWREVAHYYSAAEFSYETDRVIALSGIVNILQKATGNQYLAGFWRYGIELQLAWATNLELEPTFRQSHCRLAPTWSWLSAERPILSSMFEPHDRVYIEVLSVSVEHTIRCNSGRPLLMGLLTIKCRLVPIDLFNQPFPHGPQADELHVRGHSDKWEAIRDRWRHTVPFPARDCFGIVVGTRRQKATTTCEMILVQSVDAQNGLFERFGIATIDQEDELDLVAPWQDIDDAASFPCISYDRKDRLHTIAVQWTCPGLEIVAALRLHSSESHVAYCGIAEDF